MAPLGQQGWAVIGHVPGLGPVGARMADHVMADTVRRHVLTQPVAELGAWAMTDRAQPVPVVPDRVDLAGAVHALDPRRDRDRAVAQRLLGVDPAFLENRGACLIFCVTRSIGLRSTQNDHDRRSPAGASAGRAPRPGSRRVARPARRCTR